MALLPPILHLVQLFHPFQHSLYLSPHNSVQSVALSAVLVVTVAAAIIIIIIIIKRKMAR